MLCLSRSKACTRPLALTYINPRVHRPEVCVAWGLAKK